MATRAKIGSKMAPLNQSKRAVVIATRAKNRTLEALKTRRGNGNPGQKRINKSTVGPPKARRGNGNSGQISGSRGAPGHSEPKNGQFAEGIVKQNAAFGEGLEIPNFWLQKGPGPFRAKKWAVC